jgi:YidC/Oxa1 family membrane protein insertase
VPPQDEKQNQRLMLAMLLMGGLTALLYVLSPKPPEGAAAADGGTAALAADGGGAQAVAAPGTAGGTAAGTQAPAPGGAAGSPGGEAAAAPPARTLTVTRPYAVYALSTQGGGLTSAVLQGDKNREQQRTGFVEGWKRFFGGGVEEPAQMDLAVPVPGAPLPLAVSVQGAGGEQLPASLAYAVEEESAEGVTLRGEAGPWRVVKRLRWPGEGHQLLYAVTVTNTSGQPQGGELLLHHVRGIDPQFEEAPSMLAGPGNQSRATCFVADELQARLPDDEPAETFEGPVGYFGVDQTYFTSQLYFLEGAKPGRCVLNGTPTQRTVQAAFPLQLPAGQSATFVLGGYFGPKMDEVVAAQPPPALVQAAAAAGLAVQAPVAPEVLKLGEVMDFGIWAVLAKVLLAILRFFHTLVPNWGVAIVLLTVLVKTVLFPLTVKQMKSAEEMKKLQPRMQALQKKYEGDKERLQMETLKLYQEAKVNPLGGCLPLLVQMPVWIALYTALRTSFDIYHEPFVGPVWNDLTYRDPTYIIPLLLGASMIITQRMQPQMGDPAQQKMMTWFLPIIFTATMLNIPAGLTLYIFTNNVLSVAQQWGLRKWLERKATPARA